MTVYFDNAATTPVRIEVVDRMTEVLLEVPGNPSSTHAFGRSAKSLIENARKTVAAYLNVSPAEIIFTSGGTEADNLALVSAVKDLNVQRIITSKIEHHAVLHTVQELEKKEGITVDYVQLQSCGTPDEKHLKQLLQASQEKTLVSLMHINNEIGNMIDLVSIGNLCKEHNALFHSDMVQSVGHFDLDFQEIPVDFTAVSAHKFHGPKGAGFAFIRKNSGLKSLIYGGEQERGHRAGTEGVHNIVGLETALKCAMDNLEEERTYIKNLKQYFKEQLESHLPEIKLNGNCHDPEKSTYTLLNVCLPIPPEKALMLLFQLDLKGIACSKGSACQSGSDQGSHVLNEILNEEDRKKPSIRFSFSHLNTKEEVDYTIGVLQEFIQKNQA
ncbi:cysteine desulfurase family protein [Croceiramulus getboli]|nr:cysteine desulfurase family protein [Flavobacteriaceae bacterium YJPT1-3]